MTHRTHQFLAGLLSATAVQLSFAGDTAGQANPAFQGHIGITVKESTPDWPRAVTAPKDAPNVVLILLDDVGFGVTDLFGGPVSTPELQKLARRGLRYNNFHTTGICSPTRAALLSGRNAHRVGIGMVEEQTTGFPGYNGMWKKSTASIAEILRQSGYSTAAFGKWHNTPYWELSPVGPFQRWPTGLGFEYFYGFMTGETSQWEPSLYRNTTAVAAPATAEQGYHLTTDLVDEAIRWLHTHESLAPDKPYFLYLATGATHAPLHVAKEWIAPYRGRFDQGWDKLREETFARQKRLGVIPPDAKLTARPQDMPAWDSLSSNEKKLLARQMEVFAGFMAQTDYEVGRLISAVQKAPNGDNTLILYVAGDNGASGDAPFAGYDDWGFTIGRSAQDRLRHAEELGGPGFNNHYSAAWGWACATPFQFLKKVPSHLGGSRDPLIVSWPKRIKNPGGLRTQFSHVNDIAPTILESIGLELPAAIDGVQQEPFDGTSLVYSFDRPDEKSRHRVQYFQVHGNRAIYKDGWMAAARRWLPWDSALGKRSAAHPEDDRWELYHLERDFSQANDLSARHPNKLKELQEAFDVEARENSVYPLDDFYSSINAPGVPSITAGRRAFTYYPDSPRIPMTAVPDFTRSHRIIADIAVPDGGARGVIISVGSRYGGFALYADKGRLVYHYNYAGRVHETLESSQPLPRGKVRITYEFTSTNAGSSTAWRQSQAGAGKLYIDDRLVGEAPIPYVAQPAIYFTGLTIGRALDSPVSPAYVLPFEFTGAIDKVLVELN